MFRSTALMATLFAGLTGCATVADMRRAAPRAEYSTAKPARAVEQCLVGGFGWLSAPDVIRSGSSTEVVFGPFNNAVLHITLTPAAAGTNVQVRQRLAYGPRSRRTIEACLE